MSWFFMPPCQQPARWYPSLLERLHPGPAGIFGQTQTGSNLCRALSGSVSKGVGWATLGQGGGLPCCQLCHLCAASPSHPLWKSEKMPNNGELRKSKTNRPCNHPQQCADLCRAVSLSHQQQQLSLPLKQGGV